VLRDLLFRARALLRRKQAEADLEAELSFHLEAETAKHVRRGSSADEAQRLARMSLEGPEQMKERCRDARGIRVWDVAVQDARQGIRRFTKSPLTSVCVILTLALCIGANTAVYSIVDALFFRPLPYPDPERLLLMTTYRGSPELDTALDGFQLAAIQERADSIDAAAYGPILGANLSTTGNATYAYQQRVSAGMFRVLGVPMEMGREFTREEDVANGPALAVLSHALWSRAFQKDRNVLGKAVTVDGVRYTVIGVAAAKFRALRVSDFGQIEEPDVYTPLRPSTSGEGAGDNYGVLGRLKPEATIYAANGQLKSLTKYLATVERLPQGSVEELRALPLQAGLVYDVRTGIRVMWGATIAVLLLGCVNISGLLLAQSGKRASEFAVRSALGAGRLRIAITLLIESLASGTVGAVLGIGLAQFLREQLVSFHSNELMLLGAPTLDGRVLLVTIATSLTASLIFGIVPAYRASRTDLQSVLKRAGRTSAGMRRGQARYWLVFSEVSVAMVLITCAGLLVRNALRTTNPYPGIELKGLSVAPASLGNPKYKSSEAAAKLFRDSTAQIEQMPGIESAAVAMAAPFTRPLNERLSQIDGRSLDAMAEFQYVTASYFHTLGLRSLAGRVLTASDNGQTESVAVVNEAFSRRYAQSKPLTGSSITMSNRRWKVVGVVSSVQENNHLDETTPFSFYPEVYVPIEQYPAELLAMANQWFSPVWLIRTQGGGLNKHAIQAALQSVDPGIVFANISTAESVRDQALSPVRYRAWVVSIVSALSLLLAGIGVYGLVAQSVAERRREMGLRLALGASIKQVIGTCVAPAAMVSLAGLVFGLGFAAVGSHFLKDMVWQVSTTDPVTYLFGFVLLGSPALLASLLPAMQLLKLAPAEILQEE
jgi:predicted permease